MGWRQRFDSTQLRERARRLTNIRALGAQVERVRRAGLRGELLVPIIAALILITALGLAALSSNPDDVLTPTPSQVAEVPLTGTPTLEALDSGYPMPDQTPDSETLPGYEFATPAVSTTPITDSGDFVPEASGYPFDPDLDVPQGVDSASNDVPTPDFSGSNPGLPQSSYPTVAPPSFAPPPQANPGSGYLPPSFPTSPPVSGGGEPEYDPVPAPTSRPSTPGQPTTPSQPGSAGSPAPSSSVPDGETSTAISANATPASGGATATPPATAMPPTATARPAQVLSGDVHWTAAESPIAVDEDLAVAAGSTLTIEPGVEVRFGPDVRLTVAGTLRSQGAAHAPVRMVGVDGAWDGIVGTNGSTIVLDHTRIVQAGSSGTALSSTAGALTLVNASLTNSTGGIVALGSAVELRNIQIRDNRINGPAVNIQLPQRSPTVITGTVIRDNGTPQGAPQLLLTGADAAGPLMIESNLFVGGAGPGMQVNAAAPLGGTIRCNSFLNGTIGLQLSSNLPDASAFSWQIDSNSFTGQVLYGATGSLGFNLANNWWGDPSGPGAAERSPGGRGVPIGVNLQFQPWLDARPACAPSQ